ncbi:MAG: TonB-dependent receptor [Spirochaetia bacterium]|nr:TonB-dependent receptor [Spirochaetia bacterium]
MRNLFAFTFLVFSGAAYAQATVEIVGKKQTLADHPASATEINLSDDRTRSRTLADTLEREASVRVKRYGGDAAQSSISIRGSNPNQTNLFLDGIPLNNAVTGEANLADYNLDGIDRVQVYRSGQSTQLSGSAIGGAVNLLPGMGEDSPGNKVRLRGGTEKTVDLAAQTWGHSPLSDETTEINPWRNRYSISGHAGRSDQNFKFRNNNGTPLINEFDDFDDRRKNAQSKDAGLTGYGSIGKGNTDFKIVDDLGYRMHGVPGPGNRQTEKTEREILRNTVGLGSDSKGLGADWFRLETRGYYTYYREKFYDPLQEFSSGSSNSRGQLDTYGIHMMPSFILPAAFQTIRLFFGEEREEYHQELKNRLGERTTKVPARFRNHSAFHIEDEFSFWDKRILILPSFRYESYRDRFPDFRNRAIVEFGNPEKRKIEFKTGGLSTLVTFFRVPMADFRLRAGGSDERRIPTFLELFGEKGSVIGNPNLKPERSRNLEGGLSLLTKDKRMPAEFSVTAFRKDISDMILLVPNSQFSLRPENVDAARITGVEASVSLFILKTVRAYTNYTYQKAINYSDVTYLRGKYLPLRPMHDMHGGLTLFIGKFELGADADYIGAVFRDRTNEYTSYQSGRWVYGCFLNYTAIKSDTHELLFGINIKNLLDQRMEDVIGYPLPGRSVNGTISYRF